MPQNIGAHRLHIATREEMRKRRGVVVYRRQTWRMRGKNESESKRARGRRERERSGIEAFRGWESVLNTCFPYRIHFEPQSAVVLMSAWRSSLLHARPLPRRVAKRPEGEGAGRRGHWFISFLNNSLLFSLSIAATFWSIALDMSTIHFYLRSDAGGRWDSSPFPSSASSHRSLVHLSIRPAVCDFISHRRNRGRHLRWRSLHAE